MPNKGPGQSQREGISLLEVMRMFPDDQTAQEWFEDSRWPDGSHCPRCGSTNIHSGTTHKTMPYRCRDCRRYFSVKIGTVMEASNLGYQVWALAIFLMHTNLKGVSSMKLHRDLGIAQKNAWHLAHRIRETWSDKHDLFSGLVEIDETFIGGKRRNMHKAKRMELHGRGSVGKATVAGCRDRGTNHVAAEVVTGTDTETLQSFVRENVASGATVYTDDAGGYRGMPFEHSAVRHSVGEYVKGEIHTNGVESFWALLKRGYQGIYHQMSAKHLHRYVNEFSGRHNARKRDTVDQMHGVVEGMVGKRLRYDDLTAQEE